MSVTNTVLAAIVTSNQSPKGIQVMTWTHDDVPRVFYRRTPEGTRNPGWTRIPLPSDWVSDTDENKTMFASFVSQEIQAMFMGSDDYTVQGWHEVDMDPAWTADLDNGAALPDGLAADVAQRLKTTAPPNVGEFSSHYDVASEVTSIIWQHRRGEDLSDYTVGLMPVSVAAATLGLLDKAGIDPAKGVHLASKSEVYYPRVLPDVNGWWDVEYTADAMLNGDVLAFLGVPGTGKTALSMAASRVAYGHDEVIVMECKFSTTIFDIQGQFIPTDIPGKFVWQDGPLLIAMKRGLPLIVDEFMRLNPDVAPVFYGLMDGRNRTEVAHNPSIGTVEAKPGFCLVFTSNPKVQGAMVDEPLFSRFADTPEVLTDWALVRRQFGTDKTKEAVISACENLDTQRRNGAMVWSPQHREVAKFHARAQRVGDMAALKALIGKTEYMSNEADQEVVIQVLESFLNKPNLRPLVIGTPL